MKRTVCLLLITVLLFACAVTASAANAFYVSDTEIRVAPGETFSIKVRTDGIVMTSCGVNYAPAAGIEFISGKWLLPSDGDGSPIIQQGIDIENGEILPAVCAFEDAATVNGDVFELKLKAASDAAADAFPEIIIAYTDAARERVEERISVRVVIGEEDEPASVPAGESKTETPSAAAQSEGTQPGEASEGSSWLVFVIIGVAVVAAACATVFILRKRKG